MQLEKKNNKFLKERLSRFKPIVFIRKNIIVFSIITIFGLTLLFNIWDIKKYEIYEVTGKEVDIVLEERLKQYIFENVLGENFFLFSPAESKEAFLLYEPYLENVVIEKVAPNKVLFFVQLYEPRYVSETKDSTCSVLSEKGYVLETVCVEDVENCCFEYSESTSLVYLKAIETEISFLDSEGEKLLVVEEINNIASVINSTKFKISSISLDGEVLRITDLEKHTFVFSLADDIPTQLARFYTVSKKIVTDSMKFKSLDLRFERPVLKN